MSNPFVRQLGKESGVQLNPLLDNSEISVADNGDQALGVVMRAARGRIDKPFLVDKSNVKTRLGKGREAGTANDVNANNEAWIQVNEALNNGASHAVVQRLVGENSQIKWAVALGGGAGESEPVVIIPEVPDIETDPNWDNVIVGMHMDGANNSTSFVDLKGHAVARYGDATLQTAVKQFGTAAARFDGDGDYCSVAYRSDLDLGTGGFTIDGYARVDNPPAVDMLALDPYWNDVVFLSHFNGANGSTTFIDEKGHTVATTGGALSTAQSKFGGSSLLPTTSISSTSNDYVLGTGDFTIEAFVYLVNSTGDKRLFQSSAYPLQIASSSNSLWSYPAAGGAGNTSIVIPLTTWTHVAAVRKNGVLSFFVNGEYKGGATFTVDLTSSTVQPVHAVTSGNFYVDELRVTKAARYSAGFTVPTEAFPTTADPHWDNVVLAMHMDAEGVASFDTQVTTSSSTGANNGWLYPIWNGAIFCAFKSGTNSSLTSTDGITWTLRTMTGVQTSAWKGVAWNGTVFCLIGGGGPYVIATSPDGITWTQRSAPVSLDWKDVVWNGSVFCVVASTSVITSPDGITWTQHTIEGVSIPAIGSKGSTLCMVDYTFNASVSFVSTNNGVTWTKSGAIAASGTYSIASNGTIFCAALGMKILTSSDGLNWTERLLPVTTVNWNSIKWNGAVFLATNGSVNGVFSTDGITWKAIAFPISPGNAVAPITDGFCILNSTNAYLVKSTYSTFTDLKGNTITKVGSPYISTGQKKFGSGSYANTTSGDNYLTVPVSDAFQIDTDMTYELFVRIIDTAGNYDFILINNFALTVDGGVLIKSFNHKISAKFRGQTLTQTDTISSNVWYHIAVVKKGNQGMLFIDGNLKSTITITNAMPTIDRVTIGAGLGSGSTIIPLRGYIDDLRITKGVARYTSGFTIPASAYPDPSTSPAFSRALLTYGASDEHHFALEHYKNESNQSFLRGKVGVLTDVNLMEKFTVNAGETYNKAITALSPTRALALYIDGDQSNFGNARVIDIAADGTVTQGTEFTFNSGDTFNVALTTLSPTRALAFYGDASQSNYGNARVIDIAANGTVTQGTEFAVNAGLTYNKAITALSPTRALAFYQDGDQSGYGNARVIDVATDGTVSMGTEFTVNAGYSSYTTLTTLSPTRALAFYGDASQSYFGNARVIDIAANGTVTQGTEFAVNAGGTFNVALTTLSPTRVLALYCSDNNDYYGDARVIDIAADGTVTQSTKFTVNEGETYNVALKTLSPTRALALYTDGGTNGDVYYGNARVIDIAADGTVTQGTEFTFNEGYTDETALVTLSPTRALSFCRDNTQSNYGNARIIDFVPYIAATYTPALPITHETFVHFALQRDGSNIKLAVNGTLTTALVNSTAFNPSKVTIGAATNASGVAANHFAGYLDDLRITKGVARYSSTFTPPALAFTHPEIIIQEEIPENDGPADITFITSSYLAGISSYLLAVKHLECFNDGIKIEIHADEKRVNGINIANDYITLNIYDCADLPLFEFYGSLRQNAVDDSGNTQFLPYVVSRLTDAVEIDIPQVGNLQIAPDSFAYGYSGRGKFKTVKSAVLKCFTEDNPWTAEFTDYAAACRKLQQAKHGYGYLISGGAQDKALISQLAQLAFEVNKQLRFDIPGNLSVNGAINWVSDLNFDAKAAHLIHAFWAPFKSLDPTGQFGKGFIGTSALNVAFACLRNAQTNTYGFAPKNFPISGRAWPITRAGITQVTMPSNGDLNALARAGINPVVHEVFTGGGRYVFRDSLTQAKAESSLKKLISVADMSVTIDDAVTSYGKDCLQLPMNVAIQKYRDFLRNYFERAQSSDWLTESDDPAMGGQAWKFDVRPNAARPYDRMDVMYSLRYDGTLRQVVVSQTLSK